MEQAAAMERRAARYPARKCGATGKRSRGPCQKGAGWGTSHPGFGACKLHGGSTPSGRKAAAQQQVREMLSQDFVAELDVEPIAALLYTVRRGAAIAATWRGELAQLDPLDDGQAQRRRDLGDLERTALNDLSRWSKAAIDAGVAERQVRIAERMGDAIAAAAERAIEAVAEDLSAEVRTKLARAFGAELARLEQGIPE